jgi:hypothetical protein
LDAWRSFLEDGLRIGGRGAQRLSEPPGPGLGKKVRVDVGAVSRKMESELKCFFNDHFHFTSAILHRDGMQIKSSRIRDHTLHEAQKAILDAQKGAARESRGHARDAANDLQGVTLSSDKQNIMTWAKCVVEGTGRRVDQPPLPGLVAFHVVDVPVVLGVWIRHDSREHCGFFREE